MAAPPAACHSTVAPCFCGSLGFLHKHSRLWISSLSSPQAVSSQPTAVLLPALLSNPYIPALSPRVDWGTHVQSGACRAAARTICVGLTLSCLPQTSRFTVL